MKTKGEKEKNELKRTAIKPKRTNILCAITLLVFGTRLYCLCIVYSVHGALNRMRTENFTIAYEVRIAFGSKLKFSLAIIKVMHPTTIYDNRICCGSQFAMNVLHYLYSVFSVQYVLSCYFAISVSVSYFFLPVFFPHLISQNFSEEV